MATVISPSTSEEQRVVLSGISWATYEGLLADIIDQPTPRFTYDRGTMEMLVTLSTEHERTNRTLTSFVETLCDTRGIEFANVGSMTFRRVDLARGFEPDTCFYIQHEPDVRGVAQIDPAIHPPPDLVIEIDVSRQSMNKLPVYGGFGVPEVWRVRGGDVTIYTLRPDGSGEYDANASSVVLPPLDGEILTRFLSESTKTGRVAWLRSVRAWAQGAAR
jgi:Uma2 family endonuclease